MRVTDQNGVNPDMTDSESNRPEISDLTPADATWTSVARYAVNGASRTEGRDVEARLKAVPADAEFLNQLDSRYPPMADWDVSTQQVETALAKTRERLFESENPSSTPRVRTISGHRTAGRRSWLIPAAVAAAVVIMAVAVWQQQHRGTTQQVFRTDAGQRTPVRLVDGTRVVLAPLSRLVVPHGYGSDVREVELTGEALFAVVHDATHPFRVTTPLGIVEDVGTVFTVQNVAADSVVVRVTEGSVRLRLADGGLDPLTLSAGDAGILAERRLEARRGTVHAADTAWVHGELAFRDAPMADVVAAMHRWYGIRLRVADSVLAGRHVTASLSIETADQALKIIALSLGADVERQGDTAIVRLTRPAAK